MTPKMDLVIVPSSGQHVDVWLGNGAAGFSLKSSNALTGNAVHSDPRDFNEDGKLAKSSPPPGIHGYHQVQLTSLVEITWVRNEPRCQSKRC